MDKKTIAYILIGGAVLAAVYFLYKKYFGSGSAAALGAGQPDTRGAWAADDDAVYKQMRDTFSAKANDSGALGWVDPAVKSKYEGGGSTIHRIKDQASKAGSFLSVFEEVNPNVKGKYLAGTDTVVSSGIVLASGAGSSGRQLWPESLHVELWNMFNNLKIKYGAL